MKTYETERLLLKPTDLEDAEFILQLLNSESFIKYIGDRNVRTIEDAENYIRNRCFPQFERLGYGSFTVILKEDSSKMGTCGVYARENTDNAPDIGFAFLPEFEGKGIGKKLHQLMLDEYFSKTKETIWLSTEANSRAEIFYKKQGWKNAGLHGNEVKFEMSFEDWKS